MKSAEQELLIAIARVVCKILERQINPGRRMGYEADRALNDLKDKIEALE